MGQAFTRGVEAAVEVPVNHALALYGGVFYLQGQNTTGIPNLLDEAFNRHGSVLQVPGRVVLMSL